MRNRWIYINPVYINVACPLSVSMKALESLAPLYVDYPPSDYADQARTFGRTLPSRIRSYFAGMLPIVGWLPRYNLHWLAGDLVSAITIGAIVVPQSMAYARIAGFPPQYGLYSSFVGTLIYPFLGTSKDINIGTTAISSLMVGQILGGVQTSPEFLSGAWTLNQYAVTMALFSGIIALGVSLLRLGILFNFICQPAIAGFMAGSGLTIVIEQLPKIFGIHNIDPNDPPYLIFGRTMANIPNTRVDAAIGILSLVLLYAAKYLSKYLTYRYPHQARIIFFANISRNIVILVLTTFLSWLINHFGKFEESPFAIIGPVPSGFQLMGVPHIEPSLLSRVFSDLPSVVVLLVMEHCAIATSIGKRSDYQINVNQEIMAIGLTNIVGSFFSAYPATGSFCRTALSSKSGARTPLTNIFVGIIVVLALYVFTPAFEYIPTSCLGAVIIHAVTDLIVGPKVWLKYWKLDPTELLVFASAYVIALFARIDVSIYAPVALSLVVQLYRTARPECAFLGRLAGTTDRYFSMTHPTLGSSVEPVAPGVVCFQVRDNVVFENASYLFSTKLMGEIRQTTRQATPVQTNNNSNNRPWNEKPVGKEDALSVQHPLEAVVIDLTAAYHMDMTAVEELKAAVGQADRYAGRAVRWYFALNESAHVRKALLLGGFGTQRRLGQQHCRSAKNGPFYSDRWRDRQHHHHHHRRGWKA
ncbi:sulfate transporter family-domain-containing protein [Dichotomocladium elegans]|nr:sulfate transporter family-domain-containing protein [Dichotomocladium elegans]